MGTVVFQPNDVQACGQVLIKDDNTPENPEVFMVTFTVPDLVIPRPPELEPPVAEVTIIDDDSMFMTLNLQSSYRFRSTLGWPVVGKFLYLLIIS